MLTQEEVDDQQQLLASHRLTLSHYLKQQALVGVAFTQPAVSHGIQDARANIRRIKDTLRSYGVPVEDIPDDEELLSQPKSGNKDGLDARDIRISKSRPKIIVSASLILIILLLGTGAAVRANNAYRVAQEEATETAIARRTATAIATTATNIAIQTQKQAATDSATTATIAFIRALATAPAAEARATIQAAQAKATIQAIYATADSFNHASSPITLDKPANLISTPTP